MANGLFASPEQIRQAERAARLQSFNQQSFQGTINPGLFELGRAFGNVLRRGVSGEDTRSAAEKRAAEVQKLFADTNFSEFDSVINLANQLKDLNPQGALTLSQFAVQNLNVAEEELTFDKSQEGFFIPKITTTDKLGNTSVRVSGATQTLESRLDEISQSQTPDKPKFVGNIQTPDGILPVQMDATGLYVPTTDEQGNLVKDRVTPLQSGTIFTANQERATAGGRAERFGKVAQAQLRNVKIKGKILDRGFSEDQINEFARTIGILADANWSNSEIRKQFKNDPNIYINYLIDQLSSNFGPGFFGGLGEPQQTTEGAPTDITQIGRGEDGLTERQRNRSQRGGATDITPVVPITPNTERQEEFTIRQLN